VRALPSNASSYLVARQSAPPYLRYTITSASLHVADAARTHFSHHYWPDDLGSRSVRGAGDKINLSELYKRVDLINNFIILFLNFIIQFN
jgi:hypothetical protein